jgi:hypothetical protein
MSTATQLQPGRSAKGTFLPGNQIGKNHQWLAGQAAKARYAITHAITGEDWTAMTLRLISIVKEGKPKDAVLAFQVLSDRVIGRPKEHVEVSTPESAAPLAHYTAEQLDELERILRHPAALPAPAEPEVIVPVSDQVSANGHASDDTAIKAVSETS